ncbi:tyrosine-type recombinase/integrase [Dinghuibacter silviterrae]|uniref:Integrase/recombinase XerD n=1 Tax=Dinghuibacter silviterrae TaxID=1539049 RepID=A0A4R8DBS0_9BACT|nr:tyrosine-type recombinase/integrase [Dinghuibacter silviterrae]TDW91901.1 integrase/recombinase XerD [Dinghuibacter silviterrae]
MPETSFTHYLAARHRESTLVEHLHNLGYFTRWLAGHGLPEPKKAGYADLLAYARQERVRGIDVSTINLRLTSIRKYFAFLVETGTLAVNPAAGLHIRGKIRRVIREPLTLAELEALYQAYSRQAKGDGARPAHVRNAVILGLMVYQGLHSGELGHLEMGHIRLDDGKVYIPGGARSNPREMALATAQVLLLDKYLCQIRPRLGPVGEKVFPGNIDNHLAALIQALKQINPSVRNARHLRASVILEWLKVHNKRQVQYMAGHKHIESTEHYALQEMDSLTDQLAKHHPFG